MGLQKASTFCNEQDEMPFNDLVRIIRGFPTSIVQQKNGTFNVTIDYNFSNR